MGCISSKNAKSPVHHHHHDSVVISIRDVVNLPRSSSRNNNNVDSCSIVSNSSSVSSHSSIHSSNSSKLHINRSGFGPLEKIKEEPETENEKEKDDGDDESAAAAAEVRRNHHRESSGKSNSKPSKRAAFSIKFGRLVEGEHVAAGWPAWLSAVAGEAIDGWLPLRSDTFERLEKIGQGTYSSVYRARDLETGRMMALKKVRFDNFQPESVRFMAREITILRRLDHPNVMKLEGLITSRLSCSIYFVFEYMEHDLSGLLSCPDIKFSDSQIKCYMKQLLRGVEHCHSRGVLHRDIKTSNVLVNNEGQLKLGDFGLANFLSSKNRQPLTSRVVTLWYRPPELLLGSTNYGPTVDMWSVGCVFAELFIGRPILKGRTEVEQLHKIFKLCGSPPDEYWKKSKLPLANMFKPQQAYESVLRERCKELPKSAVNLIDTFLSIEPYKRGTAASALDSEYFTTKPYACEPSSLPKYPPQKEIDAKFREEARRRKAGGIRASGASRNPRRVRKTLQEPSTFCKVVHTEEVEANMQVARRGNGGNSHIPKVKGATVSRGFTKASYDTVSEASQASESTQASQADSIRSVPVQITTSSDFGWAKRRKHDASYSRSRQNGNVLDPISVQDLGSQELENEELAGRVRNASRDRDEIAKRSMQRQQSLSRPDSFDSSDVEEAQDLSTDYDEQQERFHLSGPLPSQSHRLDGRQPRSRFYKADTNETGQGSTSLMFGGSVGAKVGDNPTLILQQDGSAKSSFKLRTHDFYYVSADV